MGQPAKADEQRASSPTEDRNRARRLERVPEQSEIGVGPTETRELHRMHALLQAWRTERRPSPLTAAAIDLADACLGFRFGADPPPPGKNPVGAGMNFKNGCVYRSGKTLAHDAGIVAVILPTDDKDTRVRKEEVARRLFNSRKRELVEFGFLSEPVRVYPFDPSLGLEERHKCRKCRLWGGKGTSCRHPWKRGASRFTVMPTTLAALLELERAYIAAGNAPRVIRERTGTREVDARTLRARWERNKQRRATHPVAVAAKAKRAAKVAWTDAPPPSPPPAAHDVIREGQITSLSPEQTQVDRALEPELEITSSSELGSRSQITSSSVSTGTVARRAEVLPADLPPRVAPAWTDDSPSAHRGFAPCSSRPAPAPTSEPDAPRPTEPTRAEARSTPAPDTRGFATKNPAPDPRSFENTRAQAGPPSPLRVEAAMVLARHEAASGLASFDREQELEAIVGALSRRRYTAIEMVLAAEGQAQSRWNLDPREPMRRTAYFLYSRDDRIRTCLAVARAARARAAAERTAAEERRRAAAALTAANDDAQRRRLEQAAAAAAKELARLADADDGPVDETPIQVTELATYAGDALTKAIAAATADLKDIADALVTSWNDLELRRRHQVALDELKRLHAMRRAR